MGLEKATATQEEHETKLKLILFLPFRNNHQSEFDSTQNFLKPFLVSHFNTHELKSDLWKAQLLGLGVVQSRK